jgi:hypothetical protein
MRCQMNLNRWLLVAVACAAFAASASTAAERKGSTVPKSGETVSHQEGLPAAGLPDPGVALKKPSTNPPGQNSDLSENRNDAAGVAVRPSTPATANGRGSIESGSKTAGKGNSVEAPHGIDLVRPDDGYGNPGLRRRATRSSLIALSQNKKSRILPPVVMPPHLPSFSAAPIERLRNSAGVAIPVGIGMAKPDSLHTVAGLPANTGPAGNSLGIGTNETHRAGIHVTTSSTMPPVTGINGTNLGHAGASGIGGPAKDRTGINGSALRARF